MSSSYVVEEIVVFQINFMRLFKHCFGAVFLRSVLCVYDRSKQHSSYFQNWEGGLGTNLTPFQL